MNVNSGEIISMVSVPDFDLNKREDISDKKFINRSTKGVYELGSVFKTFTLAAGLQQNVIQEDTLFKNLPKKIKCAGRSISEYDMDIPSSLTAEEILIRSGNIGSIKIAQKVGLENFKNFLEKLDLLNKIQFDIDEVGNPIIEVDPNTGEQLIDAQGQPIQAIDLVPLLPDTLNQWDNFSQALEIVEHGGHLNQDGIEEIIELKEANK